MTDQTEDQRDIAAVCDERRSDDAFTCEQCGTACVTSKRWAKFCSDNCRIRAHRARKAAEAATGDKYKATCELARAMEPDALAILHAIALRLTKGREQYGDLSIDNDPRDWSREAQEELLDLVVYREIERIQKERAR